MPKRQSSRRAKDEAKLAKPAYRHWVEIRDLQTDLMRTLPLKAMARIFLPTKKGQEEKAREEYLELQDDSETIEARDVEDLAAQLRRKYPDDRYERTLYSQRDQDAEKRRASAMSSLIEMLGQVAVREAVEEQYAADVKLHSNCNVSTKGED